MGPWKWFRVCVSALCGLAWIGVICWGILIFDNGSIHWAAGTIWFELVPTIGVSIVLMKYVRGIRRPRDSVILGVVLLFSTALLTYVMGYAYSIDDDGLSALGPWESAAVFMGIAAVAAGLLRRSAVHTPPGRPDLTE